MTSTNKRVELYIRRGVLSQSPLGLILRYLNEGHYDISYEVAKLLEARFLPAALQKYEGTVEKAVASACSQVLHGLAVSIEDLAGIKPSPQQFQLGETITIQPTDSPSPEDTKTLSASSSESTLEEDELETVADANVEFGEKIFGLTK